MLKLTFDNLPTSIDEMIADDRSFLFQSRDRTVYRSISGVDFFTRDQAKIEDRLFQYQALAALEAQSVRNGNPPVRIKVNGHIIIAEWYLLYDVVLAALEELRNGSPVDGGTYRDAHTLYIDGQPQSEIPQVVPPGVKVMVSNPLPYAMRLEIGRTESGRDFVVQVPPRLYARVGEKLSGRFGEFVDITVGEIDLPEQTIKGHTGTGRRSVRRHRNSHVGEPVKSPALFFEVKKDNG
jgi:hypothetical protein